MSNSFTLPLNRPQLPVRTHCQTLAQARAWQQDYSQTRAQLDSYAPVDKMLENFSRLSDVVRGHDQCGLDFNQEQGQVVMLDHSTKLYSHADLEASFGNQGLTHLTVEGQDGGFTLRPSGEGVVFTQRTPANCEGCSWKQETLTTNPGNGTLTYLVEFV